MFDIFRNFLGQAENIELKEAVVNGASLVDVRTPDEFSTGSVPGAVNIPLDKIPLQLSRFKGKKSVVVFCRSGSRSREAKRILGKYGFTQVIDGGSWQNVNQAIKKQQEI